MKPLVTIFLLSFATLTYAEHLSPTGEEIATSPDRALEEAIEDEYSEDFYPDEALGEDDPSVPELEASASTTVATTEVVPPESSSEENAPSDSEIGMSELPPTPSVLPESTASGGEIELPTVEASSPELPAEISSEPTISPISEEEGHPVAGTPSSETPSDASLAPSAPPEVIPPVMEATSQEPPLGTSDSKAEPPIVEQPSAESSEKPGFEKPSDEEVATEKSSDEEPVTTEKPSEQIIEAKEMVGTADNSSCENPAIYSNKTRQASLPAVEIPLYTDIDGKPLYVNAQSPALIGLYSAVLQISFGFSSFEVIEMQGLGLLKESNPCHAKFNPDTGILDIPQVAVPSIMFVGNKPSSSGPTVRCHVQLQQSVVRVEVLELTQYECNL